MPGSANDIDELEKALPGVTDNAQSLGEIEAWIGAQPCVKSVQLAGYVLKSNPPQRDFIIECGSKDGTVIKKILNVYVLGTQKFQFNSMRDQ